MRGRNGTWHRYYYCRNHDPLRAGGQEHRCPERNIRADALDEFVFDQVRQALLQPELLLTGEHSVALTAPIPDDELLAAELARLDRKIDAADAEKRRLVDLYQAGLIELADLQRRAANVATRHRHLQTKRTSLAEQRAVLARGNQVHRRVHDFAERIRGVINDLDAVQKQKPSCGCSSRTFASPDGTLRSGYASPWTSPPHTRPTVSGRPTQCRPVGCQLKTVCVPLVTLKGDSYRLKDRDLGRVPTAAANER